jgi:tRNA/rRNA methyltransferase
MKTRFILIQTSHAGNVGGAARAMKTMGFDDLVLVAPRWSNVLRREETIQRASGANDVLANARIVETLDDALDGISHLCATAMTPRDFGPPTRSPRQHFEELLKQERTVQFHRAPGAENTHNLGAEAAPAVAAATLPATAPALQGVAFLFGSERYGMRNEDVYRSHVCLSIPTRPDFGSLNLAAAIQLIAYEWRQALGGFDLPPSGAPAHRAASAQAVQGMLAHWEQALVDIAFLDPAAPKKLMPRLNQLFNRAQLAEEEIHILRGIAKAMQQMAAKGGDSAAPAPTVAAEIAFHAASAPAPAPTAS